MYIDFDHPTLTPWELLRVITTEPYGTEDDHVIVFNRYGSFDPEYFCGAAPEVGELIPYSEEAPVPPEGYDPDGTSYDYLVGHGVSTWRCGDGSAGTFFSAWIGTTALGAVVAGLDKGCRVSMTLQLESSQEETWEGIALFELLDWHIKNVRDFQDSEQGNCMAVGSEEGRELYQEYLAAGGEVPPVFGLRCRENDNRRTRAIATCLLQS